MRRTRRKKKWTIWKTLIIIALVVILAVVGYSLAVYLNAKNTVNNEMHNPVKAIDTSIGKDKLKDKDTLNILLLGIDTEEDENGRSDTIKVLTVDSKNDQTQIVSIPRDTRTEIVGENIQDKVNHAYAYGGAEMSIATIKSFLDIELDYYVSMNMDGLDNLLDELGTNTGNSDMDWSEAASVANVPKLTSLVSILGENMETNLDMGDMQKLLLNYQGARKNISKYQMTGEKTRIDGTEYLNVDEAEVEKVHDMINELGG